MKNTFYAVFVLVLVTTLYSCSKDKGTTAPPSSWTFKGVTYHPDTCIEQRFIAPPQFPANFGLAAPTTDNNADSNYAFVSIIFADSTGVATGTYTVIADDGTHPPTGNQAIIHFRVGAGLNEQLYYSTRGQGAPQTISVFITSAGKLSANGTNIQLANQGAIADTSGLTFSLTAQ